MICKWILVRTLNSQFESFWSIVMCMLILANVGNYGILLPQFFRKFSSNQRFTKELYSKLIWRKTNCVAVNFSFFHTVLHFAQFLDTRTLYLQLHLITNCKLISRDFIKWGESILVFSSHCTVWKNEKFSLNKMILRQINSLVTSLVKTLLSL